MRLGIDGRKIPEAALRGPVKTVQHAKDLGLDGVFFRTVLDMSPTLDPGELREIRAEADAQGIYLETGLGKVNPFATTESPELRAVGEGDIVVAFRRMMEACAAIDCRELWVGTGNFKAAFYGRLAYDRFRTDVTWDEQLAATERFVKKLAPIAREHGIHMNFETHEEITSFEVVRLVEAIGPDTTGIVFDTGNVLQRIEHPTFVARRVAPYVRQTHLKDSYVTHSPGGLNYQLRPLGGGVVPFEDVLPVLAKANPNLNLTIENAQSHLDKAPNPTSRIIEVFSPEFLAGHPDLTVEEYGAYLQMVHDFERRVADGQVPHFDTWAAQPYEFDETVAFIQAGAAHIRRICDAQNLPLAAPAAVSQGGNR